MKIPEHILLRAEKPARYAGGEYNTPPFKPDAEFNIALCMPDVYEVGMSNLGLRILHGLLSARPDTNAELCFAPWGDLGAELKRNGIPLAALSGRELRGFDMAGFSLQYELCFSTVLYMLDLAGIPRESAARGEEFPIILAGGPCTVNPAPVARFTDLFCIGDGEEVTAAIADLFVKIKRESKGKKFKEKFLRAASAIRGVYVPQYNPDGTLRPVRRAIVTDLDNA
jgi:radical SAM superfamily enzyme YgiQ (UPF0313 family)